MPRNKFPDQVLRIDGKDAFLEVLCGSASIDKVAINFVTYDKSKPAGQREKDKVMVYLDIFEAQVLAGDILSGKISALAQMSRQKAKEAGSSYPEAVYAKLGGTSAKNTPDNKAVSRQFQVVPGAQKPWILAAMSGPGKEQPSGLIAPDGRPTTTIRIPMDDEGIKQFAYSLHAVANVWAFAKFLPVVAPNIRERRNRDKEAIREKAAKNGTDSATAGLTAEDFPEEIPA